MGLLKNSLIVAVMASALGPLAGCKPKNLTFESVTPASGRLSGGQEVKIIGTGFAHLGTLEVRIAGRPATNVGAMDEETIVLTTPEGRDGDANHPVDVSILTADGKSIVLRGAWTYVPSASERGGGPNDDLRRRL